MSPLDWAVLPLKKYATFSGRAPRAEYWWYVLLYMVIYIIAGIIGSLIGMMGILRGLVMVAFLVPSIAVGVRRLHDTDRTGWWMAALYLPLVIGFALLGPAMMTAMLQTTPGTPPDMSGVGMGGVLGGGVMFMLAGIIGLIVLVFFISSGTVGPNRYGDDPYGGQPAVD